MSPDVKMTVLDLVHDAILELLDSIEELSNCSLRAEVVAEHRVLANYYSRLVSAAEDQHERFNPAVELSEAA